MKNKLDRSAHYAVLIKDKVAEFLEENPDALEDKNATEFIHALANLVPCMIYGKLTGEEVGLLDFNHIANRLCFQNLKLVK